MTCLFHKFSEYFPGTGTLEDRGRGKGKEYAISILKGGITDEAYKSVLNLSSPKSTAVCCCAPVQRGLSRG